MAHKHASGQNVGQAHVAPFPWVHFLVTYHNQLIGNKVVKTKTK